MSSLLSSPKSLPSENDPDLDKLPSMEAQLVAINVRINQHAATLAGAQPVPEAKLNDGSEDIMDIGRWYIPVSIPYI